MGASEVLSVFEKVASYNSPWDRRFRMEHVVTYVNIFSFISIFTHSLFHDYQALITPSDMARIAKQNILLSVQPVDIIDFGVYAENLLGYNRTKYAMPLRSALENGVKLLFGSDWDVFPVDIFISILIFIQCAVFH